MLILSEFVAFTKGSGIQWPFSNKISALPHFMSFKTAQEDKSKKVASDSLVTSGFDPSNKCPAGEMQVCYYPFCLNDYKSIISRV